jgi:hypothetical protein
MSFLSKFFRRKKANLSSQIQTYLSDVNKIERTVTRQLGLIFETKLETILPENAPSMESVIDSLKSMSLPNISTESFASWKDISISQLTSPTTREALVDAFLQPSLYPSQELIRKFLTQNEFGDMIANGLQKLITEINQKLNPLSSIFKSSGFEAQMHKVIQGFVPNIQESLVGKFSNLTSQGDLLGIFHNSLQLALEIKPSDFEFPNSEISKVTWEKWTLFINLIKNDEQFKSSVQKIWLSTYSQFRISTKERMLKEILFLTEDDYLLFKKIASSKIALSIFDFEKNTKLFSQELNTIFTEIQES